MTITLGNVDTLNGGTLWSIKYATTDKFHMMASGIEGVPDDSLGTLTEGGTLTLGASIGDLYSSAQFPEGVAVFASTLVQIEPTGNPLCNLVRFDISGLSYAWGAEINDISTSGTFTAPIHTAVQASYALTVYGAAGALYVRAITSSGGDNTETAVNATFDDVAQRIFKLAADRAVFIANSVTDITYIAICSQTAGTSGVGTPSVTGSWVADTTYGSLVCLPLDSTHFAVIYSDTTDILYRVVTHSGNTISAVGAEQTLKSGTALVFSDATVMASGIFAITYWSNDDPDYNTTIESGSFTASTLTLAGDAQLLDALNPPDRNAAICRVHDYHGVVGFYDADANVIQEFTIAAVPLTKAVFYHGQGPGEGVLAEKFTLPFSGVNPGAMTLDQSLGTVVIGTKIGDGVEAAIYSRSPYPTGTSFSDGHPTGTSVTSMKWI